MKKFFIILAAALVCLSQTSCDSDNNEALNNAKVPVFTIENLPEISQVEYGKSIEYDVTYKNVVNYTIITPIGWNVQFMDDKLTITAPEKDSEHSKKNGTISITVTSKDEKSDIIAFNVIAGEWVEYELRTLTFEDKDAKFTPYELYGGAAINKWSDLIDNLQFGGELTYTNYTEDEYWWYDEGNTELQHCFTTPYWDGGHVISNYRRLPDTA